MIPKSVILKEVKNLARSLKNLRSCMALRMTARISTGHHKRQEALKGRV
jgi:hypothetical protein